MKPSQKTSEAFRRDDFEKFENRSAKKLMSANAKLNFSVFFNISFEIKTIE